jgi:hypothetical protein
MSSARPAGRPGKRATARRRRSQGCSSAARAAATLNGADERAGADQARPDTCPLPHSASPLDYVSDADVPGMSRAIATRPPVSAAAISESQTRGGAEAVRKGRPCQRSPRPGDAAGQLVEPVREGVLPTQGVAGGPPASSVGMVPVGHEHVGKPPHRAGRGSGYRAPPRPRPSPPRRSGARQGSPAASASCARVSRRGQRVVLAHPGAWVPPLGRVALDRQEPSTRRFPSVLDRPSHAVHPRRPMSYP